MGAEEGWREGAAQSEVLKRRREKRVCGGSGGGDGICAVVCVCGGGNAGGSALGADAIDVVRTGIGDGERRKRRDADHTRTGENRRVSLCCRYRGHGWR